MPQMGESIAEGTIVRWIKKVGDTVDRDEPLFEISTDKVDAEIPSPAAGVLAEIAVKEGETVPVNAVVATIAAPGEAAAAGAASATGAGGAATRATAAPVAAPAAAAPGAPAALAAPDRQRSSPLVRRIAKEHGVDISRIAGSGVGGRVTKQDILGFIGTAPAAPVGARGTAPAAPVAPAAPGSTRIEPMSVMRKKIAEHMVLSHRTSAHVYSAFEVNYTRIEELRRAKKDEYERAFVKLTYTAFIAKAIVDCLRRHPVVNASIDGDNIVYKHDINLGIAVALEQGLIVPVVKGAGEKNLLGLARAIQDVADRARAKQLNPDEVHGGTFTITNPGAYGAQFGLPLINQPQVAILGVGTIEKRPVASEDAIGIRLMGHLTLGYDHRLIDGAVADQFLADVKRSLENFDESWV
jgi:2-oxoglutarate dehydrogenase E2 component (dihydrolipoamide succinyltransferase)